MNIERNIISKRIQGRMCEMRYNQARLSKMAGISKSALSQIINCKRTASIEVLYKLSFVLLVSIDYLVGKENCKDDEILTGVFRQYNHTKDRL